MLQGGEKPHPNGDYIKRQVFCPHCWTLTHRDSGRFGALVTWFQDVFERKGMRRPNHTEGEIKGDLPHPIVLDYAAAGT